MAFFFPRTFDLTTGIDGTSGAAEDPLRDILMVLSTQYPAAQALIVGLDRPGNAHNFLICNDAGCDLQRAFTEENKRADGWIDRLRQVAPGHVYDELDLGADDMAPGPMDRVFRDRRTPRTCLSGIVIESGDARRLVIELRYPARQQAEMRRQLADTLPRLAQQLDLGSQILGLRNRLDAAETLSMRLMELLPFAVVLCDRGRHVIGMNARARALTGGSRPLSVTPDEVLHLSDPAADDAFSLQVESLLASMRKRVAIMTTQPTPSSARDVISLIRLDTAPGFVGGDAPPGQADFAMLYDNFSIPLELGQDFLWRIFGLNPRETELALALLAGESIASVSVRRKVSKETVRNQLASLMRKTNTSRQQELVALLTRLTAINASI